MNLVSRKPKGDFSMQPERKVLVQDLFFLDRTVNKPNMQFWRTELPENFHEKQSRRENRPLGCHV